MKKVLYLLKILTVIFFFTNITYSVYAYELAIIEEQLGLLDFNEVELILGNKDTLNQVSFMDLINRAITGNIDLSLSAILFGGIRLIFNEVFLNINLMKQLLIISVLAAVLRNLTDSFENKSVGELGFYVCYMLLIIVIFSSFRITVAIIEDMIISVTQIIRAAVPGIMGLILMSGNVTGAYVFNSLFIFAINVINVLIRDLFVPLIVFIATIQIVNYLTENEILSNLCNLMKSIISWGIKSIAIIFISILTLQRISAPILNTLALRTARLTINVVPVVGDILSGAVDSVLYLAQATKSGVIVAVIITVIYICIIPTIKLVAFIFLYKFTAALIQPICDKRIVKCIDTIGSYSAIMLAIAVMVVVMFTFALILMLSF